jgi:hypothetical protein
MEALKMTNYERQAQEFLNNVGATLKIEYVKRDFYFEDDKQPRDIFRFTIKRNGEQYTGKFGQSIANCGKEPTAYDILACLTKYETYGDEWDFANEFGYEICDKPSYNKVKRIYKAVQREYKGVNRLFADVIDELCEIA